MDSLHADETNPFWYGNPRQLPLFSPLEKNLETDVCVVGGGIAGLTTAYLLLREGKRVCVLEQASLIAGQSGRSTAHVTAVLDSRYTDLEKNHGTDGAHLAAESHTLAMDRIEQIALREKIDCGLQRVTGYLFAGRSEDLPLLQKEYYATRRAGLRVQLVESAPFEFFNTGPALAFPDQLQLDPVRYLTGLAQAILHAGGQIFTGTPVDKIKNGTPCTVHTRDGFQVNAEDVVVATHTPMNDTVALHTKQAPYRTYVMSFEIPHGAVPAVLGWDTLDPYHFIRTAPGAAEKETDILIIGGEDHKTGQDSEPARRFDALEYWARLRFPQAGAVLDRWSGQIMESVDGLAYLGRNPFDRDHIYVITGDSGNGLTNCTIGAALICDQIHGRENPYEKLYDPSRISFKTAGTYLRENSNVVAQYNDWFTLPSKPDFALLPHGSGTVFREGLRMYAAYKDENGSITRMSATCPHLGGVVRWNAVEKSWDCPCHGSRFDARGRVIEGPASENLKLMPADAEISETLPAVDAAGHNSPEPSA